MLTIIQNAIKKKCFKKNSAGLGVSDTSKGVLQKKLLPKNSFHYILVAP
jgi:hypothetical protein